MSSPESYFKRDINARLPLAVHTQAFGSMYGSGTPDYYYEGAAAHLWIEYKWMDIKKGTNQTYQDLLEPLQKRWIERARGNGVPAWVVVGSPIGIAICRNGQSLAKKVEFAKKLDKARMAGFIEEFCLFQL